MERETGLIVAFARFPGIFAKGVPKTQRFATVWVGCLGKKLEPINQRFLLGAALLAIFSGILFVSAKGLNRAVFSSPNQIRTDPAWHAYLRSLSPDEVSGLDPRGSFPKAVGSVYADGALRLKPLPKIDEFTVKGPGWGEISANNNGAGHLGYGEQMLKLVGFALSVPKAGDSTNPELWVEQDLDFCHPISLDPISTDKLDAFQLPTKLRMTDKRPTRGPILHLLLFRKNLPTLGMRNLRVFDERTRYAVANEVQEQTRVGSFVRLGIPLRIWHDTPLLIPVDVFCGPAVSKEIDINHQATLFPNRDLRFETYWTTFGAPKSRVADWLVEFDPGAAFTTVLARCSISEFGEQFGLRDPDLPDEVHWFGALNGSKREFASIFPRHFYPKKMEVVFMPGRKRVWFNIAGLPQMPNGRDLKNLFDAVIPQIHFESRSKKPGSSVMDREIFEAIAAACEVDLQLPEFYLPASFRDSKGITFRNLRVRDLLAQLCSNRRFSARVSQSGELQLAHRSASIKERISAEWVRFKGELAALGTYP